MATLLDINPIFAEAAKNVNFRLDAASKAKVEIFGKIWHEQYFPMGTSPRLTKDFKTILGKMNFTIAASTIDERASEPVRVNHGLSKVERSMFTHAHAFRHDHDEIRELIIRTKLAMTEGKGSDAYKQALADVEEYLMNSVKDAVMGAKARFSIIILEALTNGGVFTFTNDNDPGSPFIGDTIDFRMNPALKGKVAPGHEFIEENLDTVDPVQEICDCLAQNRLITYSKILINQKMANFLMRCKAMKGYINDQLNYPNQPLTLTKINTWMAANGYPVFEVVNFIAGIQHDYTVKEYEPFKDGQMVFLPAVDKLGTIETLIPDSKLGMASDGVTYKDYGRYEVREIRYGEKENTQYTEITKCSITGAPSITEMDKIMVLDTTAA